MRFLTTLLLCYSFVAAGLGLTAPSTGKQALLNELDKPFAFNQASNQRTALVADMTLKNPTSRPGSTDSFAVIAPGTWQIVYAPHISVMAQLGGGMFDPVKYILNGDGTMSSHARYSFPFIGSGWLSVSGTYSSQDEENVCRVDFDQAWLRPLQKDSKSTQEGDDEPYATLEDVPPSLQKDLIQAFGKFFFIEQVSVFPVSYLDQDTIVFDFQLLGTRICARKINAWH